MMVIMMIDDDDYDYDDYDNDDDDITKRCWFYDDCNNKSNIDL